MGCFYVLEGRGTDLDYLTLTSLGAALQCEKTFQPTHFIEGTCKWDCSWCDRSSIHWQNEKIPVRRIGGRFQILISPEWHVLQKWLSACWWWLSYNPGQKSWDIKAIICKNDIFIPPPMQRWCQAFKSFSVDSTLLGGRGEQKKWFTKTTLPTFFKRWIQSFFNKVHFLS